MTNRRREPRYPSRFSAMVFIGPDQVSAVAEDISQSGLFIRMASPPRPKQLLKLVVFPPASSPITLFGQVAHTAKPSPTSDRVGIGIQLCAFFSENHAWKKVVNQHKEAFELRRQAEYAAGLSTNCGLATENATVDLIADASQAQTIDVSC